MDITFRLFILWLHLLAALIWVGGLVFQLLIVDAAFGRATSIRERVRLGLLLEGRFRYVLWPAVGVVLLTGLYNVMNVLYTTTLAGGSIPPAFVRTLTIKLILLALMIVVQSLHQFVLRPKRIALLSQVSAGAQTLPPGLVQAQRLAQILYGAMVLLAAAIVLAGVALRG